MTFLIDGNYIPTTSETKENQSKFDKEKLKNIFSNNVPKDFKKEELFSIPEKKAAVEKPAMDIANVFIYPDKIPEETQSIKRDLSGIKNPDLHQHKADPMLKDKTWEKVSRSFTLPANLLDTKALTPSRATNESLCGGRNIKNTKSQGEKVKNSEFTNSIINEARQRREDNKNRNMPTEEERDEWEVVSPNIRPSDVKGGMIGTARTGFQVQDIKSVDVGFIKEQRERDVQSAKAGVEAAQIKIQMDAEKDNEIHNDWQTENINRIKKNLNKPHMTPEPTKLADNFTPLGNGKQSLDLSGLFKVPDFNAKEKSIKRDIGGLKNVRKDVSSDRSWEKVKSSKFKLGK